MGVGYWHNRILHVKKDGPASSNGVVTGSIITKVKTASGEIIIREGTNIRKMLDSVRMLGSYQVTFDTTGWQAPWGCGVCKKYWKVCPDFALVTVAPQGIKVPFEMWKCPDGHRFVGDRHNRLNRAHRVPRKCKLCGWAPFEKVIPEKVDHGTDWKVLE